ncbi:hypothetical protein EHI42_27880 [Rhizobium hidalgonense]|nr:hypothetical protein EHI42_27880 [Rhizobium hidalgonense]
MRGSERVRHIPFAPRAGRRCRQADEGHATISERRSMRLAFPSDSRKNGTTHPLTRGIRSR